MEVRLAESAGFCYGVKRALDTVLAVAKTAEKAIFSLGPLIHNPQVIEDLEQIGIHSVSSLDDIPSGSIVVMPTHGGPANIVEQSLNRGLDIVDVTCPFVSKVHKLVEQLTRDGYQLVILGDEGHTEVQGIMSRAGYDAIMVTSQEFISKARLKHRVGIVAQTTQSIERYRELVAEIAACAYEVKAFNTICNATTDRQKAALAVAREVDVMIVVGGHNSANTKRLVEICSEIGVPTWHVEVADEMKPAWFLNATRVGVTAGASTPHKAIREVCERIEKMVD